MLILLAVIFAIIAIVGGIFYSMGQAWSCPNREHHPIKYWCYHNDGVIQTISIIATVLLIFVIVILAYIQII